MNTKQKQTTESHGFTIIEVVLVLAIAGLIFLMVFIALPALQRGQRDTQRKDDLSRINTQISNYQSSNRGKIPTDDDTLKSFVSKYLGGTGLTAGGEYVNPGTGNSYVFSRETGSLPSTTEPSDDGVIYRSGTLCGDDGSAVSGSGRQYTLRVKLENQTAPYCVDNR